MKKISTVILLMVMSLSGYSQKELCSKTVNDARGTTTWKSSTGFFLKEGSGAAHSIISFNINKTVLDDSTLNVKMFVTWIYPGAAGKRISVKNPITITFKDGNVVELNPVSEVTSQWNSKAKKPIFNVTYEVDYQNTKRMDPDYPEVF